jgi:hypothetical protein
MWLSFSIMCHAIVVEVAFEREGPLDTREGLVECVAFDPRSRPDDVICEIRRLGNKGSWTASRRNVARVWTDDDKPPGAGH